MSDKDFAKIEATEKPIGDIFCEKYAFTIPPYQRPYAWHQEQASELLDDLLSAMSPESSTDGLYFLGSIVLVKKQGETEAKVVDGQQRLTTLTILFSVLRDLTTEDKKRWKREEYVKQEEDLDKEINERLRLHLRDRDQPFFEKHIQATGATDALPRLEGLEDSQSRIIENASYFREQLLHMDEKLRDDLISFILQNCFLVVVEVPTDSAARRIFTVLNARGLDLTATDILKADLLERAGPQQEEKLAKRWEEVELALDRGRFVELFGHIRMIYQREKPRSSLEEGFPEFVQPFGGDPEEFLSDVLEPYADAFSLTSDKDEFTDLFGMPAAVLVRSLERLDNKDWLPPLLLCLKKYRENDEIKVDKFIRQLERIAYFLFVTRADVNTRMFRYADILEEIDPQGRSVKTTGSELDREEIFHFLSALDGPLYLNTRIRKAVLLRLDQALSDGNATYDHSVVTIEHVCPQSIKPESQWEGWFPDADQHLQLVHRISNLVPLNRQKNSSASNWDFDRKKSVYFKKNDNSPFVLTNQVLAKTEWTPDALNQRQTELLNAFAAVWGFGHDAIEEWQLWDITG